MIRLLLGILIAVNIVLFLWIQYGSNQAQPTPKQEKQMPDFGEILLASEVAAKKPSIAGEKAIVPSLPKPENAAQVSSKPASKNNKPKANSEVLYCGEFGPLRSRNMAEGYRRSLLRGKTGDAIVEKRSGKENVGYWTMIPEMPDVATAEAMYKKLQKAGLKDLWLMRKGEHKNAISLGLYTERRYAQRHANNIKKMGFAPVVVPKQKKTRVYWVSFSGVKKQDLAKLKSVDLPANVEWTKKVCKQALTTN